MENNPEQETVTVRKDELDALIVRLQQSEQLNEVQEESSDWDRLNKMSGSPILLSDFEHKAHLVNPSKLNRAMTDPEDALIQDIALSVLDKELAYIYGIKQTCSEEWLNLGFANLAMRRKVHVQIKTGIFRSVNGIERILQTANANISPEMSMIAQGMKPEDAAKQRTGLSMDGMKKWFK